VLPATWRRHDPIEKALLAASHRPASVDDALKGLELADGRVDRLLLACRLVWPTAARERRAADRRAPFAAETLPHAAIGRWRSGTRSDMSDRKRAS
jgi:hypothetical protein